MNVNTFDFNELPVRVVVRDGEPWFVAADVCRVLEIVNNRHATKALDEDEKNLVTYDTLGGPQSLTVVSESGLYSLIFRSRKADARAFRKWVSAEVLPSVRRTGHYAFGAPSGSLPKQVTDSDTLSTRAASNDDTLCTAGSSVLAYVQAHCSLWALERQMEFGRLVQRYARSMGVMPTVERDADGGRTLVYPGRVYEVVHGSYVEAARLADPTAADLGRLLQALHEDAGAGPVECTLEQLRQRAERLGVLRWIFRKDSTLPGHRSALGKLCLRFNGVRLDNGLTLKVEGALGSRRYHVRKAEGADA